MSSAAPVRPQPPRGAKPKDIPPRGIPRVSAGRRASTNSQVHATLVSCSHAPSAGGLYLCGDCTIRRMELLSRRETRGQRRRAGGKSRCDGQEEEQKDGRRRTVKQGRAPCRSYGHCRARAPSPIVLRLPACSRKKLANTSVDRLSTCCGGSPAPIISSHRAP